MCVKWELLLPVMSFFCVCAWSVLVRPEVGRPLDPFRADESKRWLDAQQHMGMMPEQIATPHFGSGAFLGRGSSARVKATAAAGPAHCCRDKASMPGRIVVDHHGTMMMSGPQPFHRLCAVGIVLRWACRYKSARAPMRQ